MSQQNGQGYLNWPAAKPRTPPEERTSGSQFSVDWNQTYNELKQAMSRVGATRWDLDTQTGSGDDPGVVLRWHDDAERVAACDKHTSKSANLRQVYLWFEEVRKSGDRPVVTPGDTFAAAALPSGEAVADPQQPPHQVLGLQPDADPEIVEHVARQLSKKYHPDSGDDPDKEAFKDVQRAKNAML